MYAYCIWGPSAEPLDLLKPFKNQIAAFVICWAGKNMDEFVSYNSQGVAVATSLAEVAAADGVRERSAAAAAARAAAQKAEPGAGKAATEEAEAVSDYFELTTPTSYLKKRTNFTETVKLFDEVVGARPDSDHFVIN